MLGIQQRSRFFALYFIINIIFYLVRPEKLICSHFPFLSLDIPATIGPGFWDISFAILYRRVIARKIYFLIE